MSCYELSRWSSYCSVWILQHFYNLFVWSFTRFCYCLLCVFLSLCLPFHGSTIFIYIVMTESSSKNHSIFNVSCFARFLFTHRQNCTVKVSLSLLNVNFSNAIPGFPRFVLHVQCPILNSLDKNKGFVCLTNMRANVYFEKTRK